MECSFCGEPIQEDDKGSMERGHCYTCNEWKERAENKRAGIPVIIDGVYCIIEPDPWLDRSRDRSRGFSGRKFKVRFKSGVFTRTCNLWEYGKIPDRWRDKLPDNAKSVISD